ncbi:GyrI-like domain-containing protein [Maribacter sp. LLG6340-A2]|uniref:GyrI-like domain-containing protein n=1 Tax=Maribacter sp. LLG6340-A2 TaxID=3160834 RepID=UPI003868AEAC
MIKKGSYIFTLVIALFLIWYLFIKPTDYIINFKSDTFSETINQSLKLWSAGLENSSQLKEVNDFEHLEQVWNIQDSTHIYSWEIKSTSDSTSQVTVGIKDKDFMNSIMNKLMVPFTKTNFSIGSEKRVLDFMTVLKDHIENFKVTIVGEENFEEKLIAYVPIKSAQVEKALGMMENTTFIGNFLLQNGAQLDGPPMLEITEWDRVNDSIDYNFGYPITSKENLPTDSEILYKTISSTRAIKAIYNGNYITSDRAWYALLRYAKKNNLSVEPKAIEIFYNNPDMGGNSLNWKTEIYLPLKTE